VHWEKIIIKLYYYLTKIKIKFLVLPTRDIKISLIGIIQF